jgi:hypothetical protein
MLVRVMLSVALLATPAVPAGAQSASPSTTIDPTATAPRPGQPPALTEDQRAVIAREVRDDKSKVARTRFPAQLGAEVPASIELYSLPDATLTAVPIVKMYRCAIVDDKIVLVDPTTMRVVEVIDRQ